jgi:hypothetical protein
MNESMTMVDNKGTSDSVFAEVLNRRPKKKGRKKNNRKGAVSGNNTKSVDSIEDLEEKKPTPQ